MATARPCMAHAWLCMDPCITPHLLHGEREAGRRFVRSGVRRFPVGVGCGLRPGQCAVDAEASEQQQHE